jgi:hypothetical protein
MENLQERIDVLVEEVLDLRISVEAQKTMISALLKFIEFKHGIEMRKAISDGIEESIENNTKKGDSAEAIAAQKMSDKLREFV